MLVSRTKAVNELKGLIVVAPDHLRVQLRGRSLARQLARIEELDTVPGASAEHRLTVFTLRSIAARIRFLTQTDHRTRPGTGAPPQATPSRSSAARRTRCRTGRRRPTTGQLVSPRPGAQRSRLRRAGRNSTTRGQQRPTSPAPAQPQRRPSPPERRLRKYSPFRHHYSKMGQK